MRAQYMLFPVFVSLAVFTACLDPVHQDAVDALGPETDVPRGPTHRPGQTCTVCHGGKGPGSPDISIGGTIYEKRDASNPLPGVTVTVTDAANVTKQAVSNSVGNFYFFRDDWDPTYPLHVQLEGNGVKHDMKTRIGGDAGCARCHQGDGDARHMPRVYLMDDVPTP